MSEKESGTISHYSHIAYIRTYNATVAVNLWNHVCNTYIDSLPQLPEQASGFMSSAFPNAICSVQIS